MTARDFAYWLQGYFEINDAPDALTLEQTEVIKRHLSLVFKHEIDPSFGNEQAQQELNALHHDPMAHTKINRPDGLIARC